MHEGLPAVRRAVLAILLSTFSIWPAAGQRHDRPFGAWPRAPAPQGPIWLPQPGHRREDSGNFRPDRWQRGRWIHGQHDGQTAWWWVVGANWYYFTSPVYPGPDLFGPPGSAPGRWYWCDVTRDYYPYVTQCPSGWRTMLPRR
jgi:hypothetical protein